MSVDVTDYRKLRLVEAGETTPKLDSPGAGPVVQKEVPKEMQTGNEDFDKLIRAAAVLIETYEKGAADMAAQAAGAFQDHTIRVTQFQYMYLKGKVDGLKEASNLPLQIEKEKLI